MLSSGLARHTGTDDCGEGITWVDSQVPGGEGAETAVRECDEHMDKH